MSFWLKSLRTESKCMQIFVMQRLPLDDRLSRSRRLQLERLAWHLNAAQRRRRARRQIRVAGLAVLFLIVIQKRAYERCSRWAEDWCTHQRLFVSFALEVAWAWSEDQQQRAIDLLHRLGELRSTQPVSVIIINVDRHGALEWSHHRA